MGGLVAQFVSAATAALKRQVIVYGLLVASGLFLIFAAGYALNAFHALVMFSRGPIAASVAVAGGLFLFAVVLIVAGYLLAGKRSKSLYERMQASPEISRTARIFARPKRTLAPAAAGALAGAVAVVTLAILRRRTASIRDTSLDRRRHHLVD